MLRLFRRRSEPAADGARDVARLQARLEKTVARQAELEGLVVTLRRDLVAAQTRLEQVEHEGETLLQTAQRHRRRTLSSAVLRDLLLVRAGQLTHRASAAGAPQREARLIAMSDAYREAIEAGRSPGAPAEVVTLDGLRWWIPVRATDPVMREQYIAKEKLPYVAILHGREVGIGGVMLDIGAHDGSTSIPRVVLGDVEACYCAEPDPLNYECLAANIVENGLRGFVLPDRVAIGAADGEARMQVASTSRGHRLLSDTEDAEAVMTVRVRALDRWIDDLGIDPRAITFVKVDTEGHELRVLEGASGLLGRRQAAWQLEVSPGPMAATGATFEQFVALLERHFTHFIDLNVETSGKRRRTIDEFSQALEYVGREGHAHTDVIVYASDPR